MPLGLQPINLYEEFFLTLIASSILLSYRHLKLTILDCCYGGAARLGKGSADDVAKLGRATIDDVSNTFERGEGKCILAASQPYQRAFETKG
ncbi:MAG: hypothetical protein WA667_22415 [Candidatus Nitrosopolaris sp.]